ncbi:metalloregulator ArsR/SmtB family transcription factor [Niveibacterium sp. SC-1]|uniref:ArsR/SmtB family transcription factor n=1 Tax=Niveibacterium sp. SC-1 TaxID=3135646 RepID=UPI003120132A
MHTDPLTATFAALADPTRRAILARLAQGEATVNELAAPFEMALPSVSRHLKVLEQAGLIEQSRQAQWRPRRLQAAPLKDAVQWLESYRPFWESSFDRMGEYLDALQSQETRK